MGVKSSGLQWKQTRRTDLNRHNPIIVATVIAIILFELQLRNATKIVTEKLISGFGSPAHAQITPLILKISKKSKTGMPVSQTDQQYQNRTET
jgi:hypothetical protein